MAGEAFLRTYPLRFGDCDPAGIAFFPRLLEKVNWLVEDWFAELGSDFRSLHVTQGRSMPARAISVDFTGPAELGDELDYALRLARLGNSAITLRIEVSRRGGQPVLSAEHTIVHCETDNGALAAAPIPDALRSRMMPFLVES